eukprot:Rhum_TRINITY_DN2323_c0_g1::Rhum_TRINITY_DN2323_c0_g1_i1::g.6876::m.6876/K15085/SLC25A42; solute carrier family 25, member 42
MKEASDGRAGATPAARQTTATDRMVSGAIAGAVSRTVTAPIDRIRILYQVNPSREFSMRAAVKTAVKIYDSTGIPGLWRGNAAALVRVVPYSGILFCSFPSYETAVGRIDPDSKVLNRFLAGSLAGATATTLTYPLDLMRARMAAHWGPEPLYANSLVGIVKILETEGLFALFHGLRPTLLGIVPYSGVGFMTFETLKAQIIESKQLASDKEIPTAYRLAAGAVSGLLAQSLTYPLHVIRRRMQVRGADYAGMNLRQAAVHIWQKEGVNGLFKGISLTFAKGPVTVALGFTLNDLIKSQVTMLRRTPGEPDIVTVARQGIDPLGALVEKGKTPPAPEDEKPSASDSHEEPRKLHALEGLFCGAVAGCTAKTVIAPADRIKIMFQVGNEPYSFQAALQKGREVSHKTGVTGLWRGHGCTLMRVIPYSGTSYMTYDRYLAMLKSNFMKPGEEPNALVLFAAGSMAGVTATTLTYPLDLLRTRLATARLAGEKPTYPGVIRKIVSGEGYGGLFAGLRPTVSGIVPYAGLSFMTFETLKASIRQRNKLQRDRDIPTQLRLMAGGFAGLVAQSATYPLDIVRRRMQVGSLSSNLSLLGSFRQILKTEGWQALYRGLSMNWFKGPVSISISFTVNDTLKSALQDRNFLEEAVQWTKKQAGRAEAPDKEEEDAKDAQPAAKA